MRQIDKVQDYKLLCTVKTVSSLVVI